MALLTKSIQGGHPELFQFTLLTYLGGNPAELAQNDLQTYIGNLQIKLIDWVYWIHTAINYSCKHAVDFFLSMAVKYKQPRTWGAFLSTAIKYGRVELIDYLLEIKDKSISSYNIEQLCIDASFCGYDELVVLLRNS